MRGRGLEEGRGFGLVGGALREGQGVWQSRGGASESETQPERRGRGGPCSFTRGGGRGLSEALCREARPVEAVRTGRSQRMRLWESGGCVCGGLACSWGHRTRVEHGGRGRARGGSLSISDLSAGKVLSCSQGLGVRVFREHEGKRCGGASVQHRV